MRRTQDEFGRPAAEHTMTAISFGPSTPTGGLLAFYLGVCVLSGVGIGATGIGGVLLVPLLLMPLLLSLP